MVGLRLEIEFSSSMGVVFSSLVLEGHGIIGHMLPSYELVCRDYMIVSTNESLCNLVER